MRRPTAAEPGWARATTEDDVSARVEWRKWMTQICSVRAGVSFPEMTGKQREHRWD